VIEGERGWRQFACFAPPELWFEVASRVLDDTPAFRTEYDAWKVRSRFRVVRRTARGRRRCDEPPGGTDEGWSMTDDRGAEPTLESFITERARWFLLAVMENEAQGFDIVLRLDGTYRLAADAHRVAERLGARLAAVLSPAARREWETSERCWRLGRLRGRGEWNKEP